MTADEAAKDIVEQNSRCISPWGPACWNRPIRLVWHMISKDVATGSNAKSLFRLRFEGVLIEVGYRIDTRIDHLVLVKNETVETILPIRVAHLLTYLKLSGLSLGLIIN